MLKIHTLKPKPLTLLRLTTAFYFIVLILSLFECIREKERGLRHIHARACGCQGTKSWRQIFPFRLRQGLSFYKDEACKDMRTTCAGSRRYFPTLRCLCVDWNCPTRESYCPDWPARPPCAEFPGCRRSPPSKPAQLTSSRLFWMSFLHCTLVLLSRVAPFRCPAGPSQVGHGSRSLKKDENVLGTGSRVMVI